MIIQLSLESGDTIINGSDAAGGMIHGVVIVGVPS
jgi:hypothetical protein